MTTSTLVVWLICAVITVLIGRKKNIHPFGSFALGALLGLIGVVIMLVLPAQLPKAPEGMRAVKCPRCNTVQNVPLEQMTFECWQCKTTAHSSSESTMN